MSRSKSPPVPTQSIKRLFEEFMKTNAATIKGTYVQYPPQPCPDDYDSKFNYRPRPLFEHLYAVANFLGDDIEDRFQECVEETKSMTFRPEAWEPDEEEEGEVKQAAE